MSRSRKIILLAFGGFVAFIVLVAAALLIFVDTNAYRSRIEAAASAILRMEVSVVGQLRTGFFPGLHVTLNDVYIHNRGTEIFSAEKVGLGIGLLPLLQRNLRINTISLKHPVISVERDQDGKFNIERPGTAEAIRRALDVAKVSLSGTTFLYADKPSGKKLKAGNCDLTLRGLRFPRMKGPDIMKNLSFAGEISCEEFRTNDIAASDLKVTVDGKNGVFDVKPVTMQVFGAQGSGSIRADFTDAEPFYHVRYSLPQFRIEEFIKTLSPPHAVEGSMDFSADLTMHGKTVNEMKRTMKGQATLRGENLTLIGRDLDQDLTRYESSQNFNLVDVGAFFFAGPVGLALTKGYNFASLFQGSGGSTAIRRLVSDWKVEHGMAQAQDVAMATDENRIALRGRLDFVNESFDNVTVALIDAGGCAKMEQTMHGTFRQPAVEKPNILESLTGPARELFMMGKDLFTGGECEVFYNGSVAAPK